MFWAAKICTLEDFVYTVNRLLENVICSTWTYMLNYLDGGKSCWP